jgi:uncharacterized protein
MPELNEGSFVYCIVNDITAINPNEILLQFREKDGITVVVRKELADSLGLDYSFVCSWITLGVYSSLELVGLTAAFSKALSDKGISCNVVAAFNHDHIFVNKNDTDRAMKILSAVTVRIR